MLTPLFLCIWSTVSSWQTIRQRFTYEGNIWRNWCTHLATAQFQLISLLSIEVVETVPQLRQLVAGIPEWRPGFDSRSVHAGFVVDEMALGQVSPAILHSLPVSHSCIIGAGTMCALLARVPSRPSLIPKDAVDRDERACAGFGGFTPVIMKSIIFWDMTSCSPLSCNRRFGGTYRPISIFCLLAGFLNLFLRP
jgi:hypothetical protein